MVIQQWIPLNGRPIRVGMRLRFSVRDVPDDPPEKRDTFRVVSVDHRVGDLGYMFTVVGRHGERWSWGSWLETIRRMEFQVRHCPKEAM